MQVRRSMCCTYELHQQPQVTARRLYIAQQAAGVGLSGWTSHDGED